MAGANNEFPIIDGVVPSWADVTARITPNGAAVLTSRGIKSISSGADLEIGVEMHAGRVYGTTVGQAKANGSMTLYLSAAQDFIKALKDAALTAGYTRDGGIVQAGLVFFQLDYAFTPPGTDTIWERRLKGCRLIGNTEAPAEGTDATTVDYTLHVTERVEVVDGVEVALI